MLSTQLNGIPETVPMARYRFHVHVQTSMALPDFPGIALRESWRRQMRQLACMTRLKTCSACPLYKTCPYPSLFTPVHIAPHPYIIEAMPYRQGGYRYSEGDIFSFDMVLIGHALRKLSLIIVAWQRAMKRGFGTGKGKGTLLHVDWIAPDGKSHLVYDPEESGSIETHETQWNCPEPPASPVKLSLKWMTPLHWWDTEKPFNIKSFFEKLQQQTFRLLQVHAGAVTQQEGNVPNDAQILAIHELHELQPLSRMHYSWYSKRLACTRFDTALYGTWIIQGDVLALWSLLVLGQYLHIGRKSSAGFGKYRVKWEPMEGNVSPILSQEKIQNKVFLSPYAYLSDCFTV